MTYMYVYFFLSNIYFFGSARMSLHVMCILANADSLIIETQTDIWPGLHCPAILITSDILLNKLKVGRQMTHLVVEICTEMVYLIVCIVKMQSFTILTEKTKKVLIIQQKSFVSQWEDVHSNQYRQVGITAL